MLQKVDVLVLNAATKGRKEGNLFWVIRRLGIIRRIREGRASGSPPTTCQPAETSQRLCQETGLAEDGRVLSAGRHCGGRRQWKTRLEAW